MYGGWQGKRLTQEEAARIPGVSDRTFRRYVDRYEDSGLEGLVDKRLSQDSHRRAPVDEVMALQEMYRQGHSDWNLTQITRRNNDELLGIQKMYGANPHPLPRLSGQREALLEGNWNKV